MNQTAVVLCLFAIGCSTTEATPPPPQEKPRTAERHNVRKAAVPAGTELSCNDLLPEATASELLGKQVVVASRPARGATAVCSITLAGEVETPRAASKGNRMTQPATAGTAAAAPPPGPGDELCEITINCSLMTDADSELAACASGHGISDREIGAAGCLREFAGERYSYASLDHDTGCRYEVVAGVRLKGDAGKQAIRACAQTAVDAIAVDNLKSGA